MELVTLKPVEAGDADELFPLVFRTPVTDSILWEGPDSLEDLRARLTEREALTREGRWHQFTIVETGSGKRIGSIDVRPYADGFRGDLGLWVGVPFQRKGYGTEAIEKAVRYGFERLALEKIEAMVFVGNDSSRRAFEKAGFALEGTIRRCKKKRGGFVDVWLLGCLK